MRDDEFLELVNLSIDGEATEEQRAALAEIVGRSPAAQQSVKSLTAVAQRLDMAGREDPPEELRSGVMAMIAGRRPAQWTHPVVPIAPPLRRRLLFAAGWAAIAGAVLLVLIVAPMRFLGRGGWNTAATMARPASFDWPVAATVRVGRTTVMVRRNGDNVLLEPIVAVARPATISIAWPAADLTFIEISGGREASAGTGFAAFALASPNERGGVVLRPRKGINSAEIRVEVNSREMLRAVVPLR